MKEGQCRARPRHPPVVAADMQQRRHRAARDKAAHEPGVVPFGRGEDGEPFAGGARGEECVDAAHPGRGPARKFMRLRRRALSYAAGGSVRPLIQSHRFASFSASSAS